MRITEAAQRLGTSPRMLRYREALGLLPPLGGGAGRGAASGAGRGMGSGAGRGMGSGAARRGGAEGGAGRGAASKAGRGPGHRQFREQDVAAVALALDLERRLDISPAALAFGLRVLAEPGVRAQVAELGRRIGRVAPPPGSALEFEKERALRLLGRARRPVPPAAPRPRSALAVPGLPPTPASPTGSASPRASDVDAALGTPGQRSQHVPPK